MALSSCSIKSPADNPSPNFILPIDSRDLKCHIQFSIHKNIIYWTTVWLLQQPFTFDCNARITNWVAQHPKQHHWFCLPPSANAIRPFGQFSINCENCQIWRGKSLVAPTLFSIFMDDLLSVTTFLQSHNGDAVFFGVCPSVLTIWYTTQNDEHYISS